LTDARNKIFRGCIALSNDLSIWIAAISILAIYSFLIKENPLYRIAEHLYVGLAAGYSLAVGYSNVRTMAVVPILEGKLWLFLPCLLGVLMFMGLVPRYAWLRRYPVSFLVGVGTGIAMKGIISSRILAQIRATMVPLNSFNDIILIVGVGTTIAYFLLTVGHHSKILRDIGRVGRTFMMVSFGVVFATSIFDNFALLIGTFKTILQCFGFAV